MITLPFAWISDIHLDCAILETRAAFYRQLKTLSLDRVVLTGDISTSRAIGSSTQLVRHLLELAEGSNKEIVFCLGNHDFWHSSIAEVDAQMRELSENNPRLIYLPAAAPIRLPEIGTYLIGINGYSDGRAGSIHKSSVWLNDYNFCKNFVGCGKSQFSLEKRLNGLGDQSADEFKAKLREIPISMATKIYVATHAPPFEVAHWYNGRPADKEYSPHFVNVALGNAIKEVAKVNKQCSFVVISGHTHEGVHVMVEDNVQCVVALAKYGAPWIQGVGNMPFVDGRRS